MSDNKLRVAILGASGYTGAELVRLLSRHPHVAIVALTADRQAGKPASEVFPHLGLANLPALTKIEEVDWNGVDFVFCGLPHGLTQEVVAKLPRHLKIVDLSADFRLGRYRHVRAVVRARASRARPAEGSGLRPDRDQSRQGAQGAAGRQSRLLSDLGAIAADPARRAES